MEDSPLKYHVTFGVGAPMARQLMVASFPSSTVMFVGGVCIIGGDATSHTHSVSLQLAILT